MWNHKQIYLHLLCLFQKQLRESEDFAPFLILKQAQIFTFYSITTSTLLYFRRKYCTFHCFASTRFNLCSVCLLRRVFLSKTFFKLSSRRPNCANPFPVSPPHTRNLSSGIINKRGGNLYTAQSMWRWTLHQHKIWTKSWRRSVPSMRPSLINIVGTRKPGLLRRWKNFSINKVTQSHTLQMTGCPPSRV